MYINHHGCRPAKRGIWGQPGIFNAKKLCNVTLELSAKPFFDDSEDEMYRVCRKMFGQWRQLTDVADTVSLLLGTADGSENLEYSGDLA